MSSGKCRPFCLGLNVLTHWDLVTHICLSELGWEAGAIETPYESMYDATSV